eukprot:s192_g6.t2
MGKRNDKDTKDDKGNQDDKKHNKDAKGSDVEEEHGDARKASVDKKRSEESLVATLVTPYVNHYRYIQLHLLGAFVSMAAFAQSSWEPQRGLSGEVVLFTFLYGFSLGPLFPGALLVAEEKLHPEPLNGRAAGFTVACAALGEMLLPLLTGLCFDVEVTSFAFVVLTGKGFATNPLRHFIRFSDEPWRVCQPIESSYNSLTCMMNFVNLNEDLFENHKFVEQEALIRAILVESTPWRALEAHGQQDDSLIGPDAGAMLDSQDVDIMIPAFPDADVAKPYQAFDREQVADQDEPSCSSTTKAPGEAQSPSTGAKKATALRGLISMEFEKAEPTFVSWVKGPLDAVMGVAVLLNLALMAAMSQEVGYQADVSLGLAQPGAGGMSQSDFEAIDIAFFFVYLTDVCVRMLVLRKRWLYHHGIMYMNLFDAFLVCVHAGEIVLAAEASSQASATMRGVKLLRLVRTVRIIRTVAIFRELRLLVSTMMASLGTFFWSIVLLALVKVTMALILCQLLQDFILDEQKDLETRLQMNLFYGSFLKSLFTMFEVTFSGSWPTRFRPVVDRVDPWYSLLLLSSGWLCWFIILKGSKDTTIME